jgi:hypothetical protein
MRIPNSLGGVEFRWLEAASISTSITALSQLGEAVTSIYPEIDHHALGGSSHQGGWLP